jgi:hypothetical protein
MAIFMTSPRVSSSVESNTRATTHQIPTIVKSLAKQQIAVVLVQICRRDDGLE